jgi:Fe-S cluster biogenesis protein NfuA
MGGGGGRGFAIITIGGWPSSGMVYAEVLGTCRGCAQCPPTVAAVGEEVKGGVHGEVAIDSG